MKTRDLIDKLSQSADLLRSLAEAEEQRAARLSDAERDLLLADALALLKRLSPPKRDEAAIQFYGVRKRLSDALKRDAA
jgi:hypothetical protein